MHDEHRVVLDAKCIARMQYLYSYLKIEGLVRPVTLYHAIDVDESVFTRFWRTEPKNAPQELALKIYNWLHTFCKTTKVWTAHWELSGVILNLFAQHEDPIKIDFTSDEVAAESDHDMARAIGALFLPVSRMDPAKFEQLSSALTGIYRVIRFASSRAGDGEDRVVCAVMEIKKRKQGEQFFRFELHFPRSGSSSPKDRQLIHGFCVPVGLHVYFVGRDESSGYPFIATIPLRLTRFRSVNGLVHRRHVQGSIVGSRFCLSRVRKKKRPYEKVLKDSLSKVSIYTISDPYVSEKLDGFLSSVVNYIPNSGKSPLTLFE